MLAQHLLHAPDHRQLGRTVLVAAAVTAGVSLLIAAAAAAMPPRWVDGRPAPAPDMATAAAFEAFTDGGAVDGLLGIQLDESGRFAARADVVSAQHTTVGFVIGGRAEQLNVSGARIYGLFRGARDLTSLEGARVLVEGACPPGARQLDARCVASSVRVRYDASAQPPIDIGASAA